MLLEYNTKGGSQTKQPTGKTQRDLNRKLNLKEKPMSTFANALYRDLTCAAAAILITVVMSMGLVESTSVAPGSHAASAVSAARA